MSGLRSLLAGGCLAVLFAGTPALAQTAAGSAESGAAVAARWCSECHATGSGPRAADVGPAFPEIARARSEDYIRGFLANPHVRGQMPPFDLTRQHIEDLVAYLQSLR